MISLLPFVALFMMEKDGKIVIVGAGIFGLTVARQLALEGFRNIFVLDRHVPPVWFPPPSHSPLI